MIINNNIPALNTFRQMGINNGAANKAMEKLSSGLRINRAGDDAAGLAISEKMRAQIRGLDQASRNSQDGISMIQTAEGALQETQNILQRMRELATQAANDTNVDVDREEIQKEINALTSEINRIGNTTEFNTQKLLDGGLDQAGGAGASFQQVTAGTATATDFTGQTATITINGVTATLDDDYTDADGVVAELNAQFADSGITFTNDGGNIKISAAEEFTIEVTEGTAATGFTDGDAATSNVPAGLDIASAGNGFSATFQIGANMGQSMTIEINDMRADALGLTGTAGADHAAGANDKAVLVAGAKYASANGVSNGTDNNADAAGLSVANHEDATAAIQVINNAIEAVSAERSKLGAYQNRLEHTISNLDNSSENLSAAESRIRDVDMAKEIMEMTRANILGQASQAMLAQANQAPQSVLQLLG